MISDFNEILIASSIIAASIILARISNYLVENYVKKHAQRTNSKLDARVVDILRGPIYYVILLIGFTIALKQFSMPVQYTDLVDKAVLIVIIVISSCVASSGVQLFIFSFGRRIARRTKSSIDDEALPFLAKIAYFSVYIIAFMIILSEIGIDITPLVAIGGVAGIAIGFAAQESISNILAGFFIFADRPFKKGDRIEMGNFLGEVVDVGLRSTKIETLDHTLIIMPNAKLISNEVTNYALPDLQVKVRINFGVAYGSDIEKVKKIALDVARDSGLTLKEPEPNVYFMEMGDSSLDFTLIVWLNNFKDRFRVIDEMNSRLYNALNKEKIEIPFPCRTVYMRK